MRANTNEAKAEARERFLAPFLDHLFDARLGHISEIADATACSIRRALKLSDQILCKVWPATPTKLRNRRCTSIARPENNQIEKIRNP